MRLRYFASLQTGDGRSGQAAMAVLCAICISGCGDSRPTTPPTGVSSVASTSVASTTTSVPVSSSLRYIGTFVQTAPLPTLPLDVSLFFRLPGALGPRASLVALYESGAAHRSDVLREQIRARKDEIEFDFLLRDSK